MRSLTLAVLLLASTALAGVPHKVGYQGLLLKNDGTPETGTLQFTFTIYDASSAGAPLWTETQQIMLAEGYYATQLGAVVSLPDSVFSGPERFLEVAVGPMGGPTVALTPRMALDAVPYALNAGGVTGGVVDATSIRVNGTEIINGSGALVGPNSLVGLGGLTVDGGAVALPVCTNGDILRYGANSWGCAPYVSDAGFASYFADGTGGLQLTGTTFSLVRTCSSGQQLSWNGTAWACSSPTVASLDTGSGLNLTTSGVLSMLRSCTSGQLLKWNGTAWACAADNNTFTSLDSNPGLSVTGGALSLLRTCNDGQVLKWTAASSTWACQNDLTGAGVVTSVTASAPLQVTGTAATPNISFSGQVPLGNGGTGASTAAGARTALGAAASGSNTDITGLSGLVNPLSIGQGGTGATTVPTARAALGAAAAGANTDITSIGGLLSPLSLAQGGTGATSAAGARSAIAAAGSGANNDITSLGALSTAITVAQGGTGATTTTAARSALGAAASGANGDITSLSNLSTAITIAQGGTGATSATNARSALGAAASGANGDITSLTGLTTALSVSQGGTGITTTPSSGMFLRGTSTQTWAPSAITVGDLPLTNTYVQNQSSSTQVADFNISGAGSMASLTVAGDATFTQAGTGAVTHFVGTGAGGKEWQLLSTSGAANQGQGKFVLRDFTDGTDALTVQAASSSKPMVGIGVTNPSLGLNVANTTAGGNGTVAKFGTFQSVYLMNSFPQIGFNGAWDNVNTWRSDSTGGYANMIGSDPATGDMFLGVTNATVAPTAGGALSLTFPLRASANTNSTRFTGTAFGNGPSIEMIDGTVGTQLSTNWGMRIEQYEPNFSTARETWLRRQWGNSASTQYNSAGNATALAYGDFLYIGSTGNDTSTTVTTNASVVMSKTRGVTFGGGTATGQGQSSEWARLQGFALWVNNTCSLGACPSDARFKKNVVSMSPVLERLTQLRPVTFDWRTDEFPDRSFSAERDRGFIAQEVEQVLPEMVTVDKEGYRHVLYDRLPLLTVQAMKELKARNDAQATALRAVTAHTEKLEAENRELKQRLEVIERALGLKAKAAHH
jgi:hypothetical protein